MKKTALFLSLILATTSYSQDYNFTYFNEEYQDLEAPILPNQDSICFYEDILLEVKLGFTFPYYSSYSFDRIGIHPHFLFNQFNISPNPDEFIAAQLFPFAVAASCRRDDFGNYVSEISYKTVGEIGSRICKIQWKNLSFNNSDPSDYINYQTWLYENGTIEYRYGGNQLSSETCFYDEEESGFTCLALYNEISGDVEPQSIYLTGNVTNPSVDFGWPESMIGVVDSSMVYRFSPLNLSLEEKNTFIKLFPNPVVEELIIKTTKIFTEMTVTDISGRELYAGEVKANFNFKEFSSGSYFINFRDENNLVETHKIIKK
jgi:hypothetical protein